VEGRTRTRTRKQESKKVKKSKKQEARIFFWPLTADYEIWCPNFIWRKQEGNKAIKQ
jgi:hypothetical protein